MIKCINGILSILTLAIVVNAPVLVKAETNVENLPLLDIEPASELRLNISFPKSMYKRNSAIIFRYGQTELPSINMYSVGEYCEIFFKDDPTSFFSKGVNINRTVKIKFVNEAWAHSPGNSIASMANNYRFGNNIWLEDDIIQRISCYFVADESLVLTEKEITEVLQQVIANDEGSSGVPFLVEEKLHYRLSLNNLTRHFGTGLVSLNNVSLESLNFWDQQSRKTIVYLRAQLKAKGRAKFMKEEDEKARLAIAAGKLIKMESAYRRNFGIMPDVSLDGNAHFQAYMSEQMEKENFPQDIRDLVNNK